VLVVSACGAAQPSSGDGSAGLVFSRTTGSGQSNLWVADADGSNAREFLEHSAFEALSPDGSRLAYTVLDPIGSDDPLHVLQVREVGGGKPKSLGNGDSWVWAPDGRHLAVRDFDGISIVDVESGKRRRVVAADVGGYMRFSPDGESLVYARNGPDDESDVFVVRVSDGRTRQLTFNAHSDFPVWGREWIVYRHFRFVNSDHWPTVGELRLIRPDGSGDQLFARGFEDLAEVRWGLFPVELSSDDERLLACISAEFFCRPVTFTLSARKGHVLSAGDEGDGVTARDLSVDGSEVLVDAGRLDGPSSVYAIPFEGGPARVLIRDAERPSWAPGIPPTTDDAG
jgi:WD40-like Beta Propeller Repeat